jgi:hypothetical protein
MNNPAPMPDRSASSVAIPFDLVAAVHTNRQGISDRRHHQE